jgi:cell division protein FtsB
MLSDMVIRKRYRNFFHAIALYAVAGGCVGYFLYHAQNGSRGLESKQSLQAEMGEIKAQIAMLKTERKAWEERVELLRRDATDRDILEERARDMLGRVHRNDVVIMER